MAKGNGSELDNYIEDIIKGLKSKLDARKDDVLGLIPDHLKALGNEEMIAYQYLMMVPDEEVKNYAKLRYFRSPRLTYKQISDEEGYSEGKVYYVRRRLIDGLNDELEKDGYGFKG